MSEKKSSKLSFDAENPAETELWNSLGDFPAEEPSAQFRQTFYRKLEQASRPTFSAKLRDWLGFSGNTGWITATACVLVGLGTGALLSQPEGSDDGRLAMLEQNVSILNRNLILDRLDNDMASRRLRGINDAAYFVGDDTEITQALLQRATEDRVHSVRAAAIDALGSRFHSPAVSSRLMDLLQQAESPLVQLALVDLVLRNGNQQQIMYLLMLAEEGLLHSDIARHVLTSLNRDVA